MIPSEQHIDVGFQGGRMAAIALSGVTFGYDEAPVLQRMDLEVERGERFALLGPNGSGKTTTIRLLLGLLRPQAGSVQVLDLDPGPEGNGVRSRTGALLEDAGSYEALSVLDNLRFYAELYGVTPATFETRAAELIEFLGLSGLEDRRARDLSLGQKRKLALARAMLHEPELLILDEPTNGLDPIAAQELYGLLTRLTDEHGTTLLVTTHNLVEVESVCHRAAIIDGGRLIACDTIEALTERSHRPSLTLVCSSIPGAYEDSLTALESVLRVDRCAEGLEVELAQGGPVNAVLQHAISAGLAIHEVRRHRASLTDVYVDHLTGDQQEGD
jgi:ABC-2 type transport system ATP-binding protein